jgi:hypothetical protein
MNYGVIDFSRVDTTPGSGSAFAPPREFDGDYREFMRKQWALDPGARQHVVVVGRMLARGEDVAFVGLYAQEAQLIAEAAHR